MSKWLMTGSALTMGAVGVACSLMPHEMLQQLGESAALWPPLLLQLLGAAYFGLAMINWMGKLNLIGGVFGRPVAFGNLAHFAVAALALLKAAQSHASLLLWLLAAIYGLFAVLFAMLIFRHPGLRQCG